MPASPANWATFEEPPNTEELRMMTRMRSRLISQRSRLYNSINTRLWQWNCAGLKYTARHKLIRACIEDLAGGRYCADLEQFEGYKHCPATLWQVCCQMYTLADEVNEALPTWNRKWSG